MGMPLEEDPHLRTNQKLESLLLEGLNSGDPVKITPAYWKKKRLDLIERHTKRKNEPYSNNRAPVPAI